MKKGMNSNMCDVDMCECVRLAREGLSVKHESLGQTNSEILGGPEKTRKILMEESQQEVQSNPGTRPFTRCFKQIAVQVCTKLR
jgi:hypothetical protein